MKVKKNIKKSQPNFKLYVKKIEVQTKKRVLHQIVHDFEISTIKKVFLKKLQTLHETT